MGPTVFDGLYAMATDGMAEAVADIQSEIRATRGILVTFEVKPAAPRSPTSVTTLNAP